MRIAVIGSGIAGLGCAWLLSRQHEVVLFERDSRLGGHTHTHDIERFGQQYRIDTGFIVHNREHYPLLSRLFDEIGVATQPTRMSFSVRDDRSGLEYNAESIATVFCQRRNLLSPPFWGMVRDITRFYREAPALLKTAEDGPSLGDYLVQNRYSKLFIEDHLLPMASALWSSPQAKAREFPAKYLVAFMANHQMLQLDGRPQWRVVTGGSDRYVLAMTANWPVQVRLSSAVQSVQRNATSVRINSAHGEEIFDQVVFACHSDQALALLRDASEAEQAVLGAITYQHNDVVLHTDARVLPQRKKAWAAWNAHVAGNDSAACSVSYCMNVLQSIASPEPFIVSLNRSDAIDPNRVIARMDYQHPVYTHASVAAQGQRARINGHNHTWYCGAYWGFGFHEDGLRSGVEVAQALGVAW
ncbi:MAG: dehydrogenase [Gammaproteobacteria bacterium HGW-Gammaproteobacteria-2]|jgi:hypothetical protein|nr:MAG: dehydrogenase [Gammaproteobacteria bacterium HGW-Gammaproteobacteria-2]